MRPKNNHINYIEFSATNLTQIKAFYTAAFNWEFTDYGPNYTAFTESGIQGGFEKTDAPKGNSTLVVLYHADLTHIKNKIIAAGGTISKDIFAFPGGHRFHFLDPSNNELAVWSE